MPDAPSPRGSVRASARRVLRSLVQKELREIARDGRFWMVALVIASLLLVTLAIGHRQSAAVRAERAAAQQTADDHFRDQGEKNPHVAAHYGTYVFKPNGALSFVDPGVDPFVGVSIKLQAHARSTAEGARAADATFLSRLGNLSVAAVLQLLVPLLIIGLGFSAWTAERERGTLRLLATSGVRSGLLFAGKALGLGAGLGVLLLPAIAAGALVTAFVAEEGTSPGRAVTLAVVYAAYFGLFLALTLAISARAGSSRASLVALLGVWVVTTLVMPRAATDLASLISPLPPQEVMKQAIRHSMEQGLPGGAPREERIGAITDALLEEQGFKGAETLMDASLLGGIELQAEARFENEVIDYHHARLVEAVERQEAIAAAFGAIAPPVTIAALSSAIAGTDHAHHRDFEGAAERHRRSLVDMLNRDFAEKGGADGWSYTAGRDTWERAPAFRYQQPSLGWVLGRQRTNLVILVAWLVGTFAVAARAARRIRVV